MFGVGRNHPTHKFPSEPYRGITNWRETRRKHLISNYVEEKRRHHLTPNHAKLHSRVTYPLEINSRANILWNKLVTNINRIEDNS